MPLGARPLDAVRASRRGRAPAWPPRRPAPTRRPMTATRPYRYDAGASAPCSSTTSPTWPASSATATASPTRTALHDPANGRRWTYAQLWADSGRLAAGLRAARRRARRRGRLRAVQLPRVRAHVAGRPAPGGDRLTDQLPPAPPARSPTCSMTAGPRRSSTTHALTATAADALTRAEHRPGSWPRSGPARRRRAGHAVRGVARPRRSARRPGAAAETTVYDETTRLYTSGTTGMPKGVSLNSLVEVLSAHDVIMHFPLSPEDRTLNMTPWFHRGGLYSGGPNPVLYVGAEAVALRAVRPRDRARLGAGAPADVPDRGAHQPGDADRRADRAAPRPEQPEAGS